MRYVPFVIEPQTAPERREWFRDGVVNVLSVGKFQELKNHRPFIEVVSRLSELATPVQATIVGECYERRSTSASSPGSRSFIPPLGLCDRVIIKDEPPI